MIHKMTLTYSEIQELLDSSKALLHLNHGQVITQEQYELAETRLEKAIQQIEGDNVKIPS